MKRNETRTQFRIYWTSEYAGMFFSHFRPINQKNGRPWQASRAITDGRDSYLLTNWNTKKNSGVIIGQPPAFDEWKNDWTGCCTGFSTEELAIAALAVEQKRSGK